MSWSIQIPHRSRDEPLSLVAAHCRTLDVGDRDVAREFVLRARLNDGLQTAGELLDHLAGLEPAERRAMLDQARAEVGLEATADVDARDHFAALQRMRVTPGSGVPFCGSKDCNNIPMRFGAPYEPDVRRWWCPAHEHVAGPGDMEPRGHGLRISPSGALVPDDPADDASEAAHVEQDRRDREVRHAERAVDAEAAAAHRRACDEAHNRELPPHLRRTPT